MKNYKSLYNSLYIISGLLLLGFIIKTTIDCITFSASNAVSLYVSIGFNFVLFIVPSILCVLFTKFFENERAKRVKANNKPKKQNNLQK